MDIRIIGKEELKGVGKNSGKPYHFYVCYYMAENRYVEGYRGERFQLDPKFCPYDQIRLGSTYRVDFDQRGYVVGFELAKEK